MGDVNGMEPGIHAEHNAINNLKPTMKTKKLTTVNILVVRFSKNNKLHNSKPCTKCIQTMINLPKTKGYRIKNVYYSDDNGNIIKTNLRTLETDVPYYTRFYRKHLW